MLVQDECRTVQSGDKIYDPADPAFYNYTVDKVHGPLVWVDFEYDYEEDDGTIEKRGEYFFFYVYEIDWDAANNRWITPPGRMGHSQ